MPPKRPSPLEDPPAASSTSGEEEEEEEESSEEDEEEEVEEGNEEAKPSLPPTVDKKSSLKKFTVKPRSTPSAGSAKEPQSSDDEEDDESGSESSSDSDPSPENPPRPSRAADSNIKPLTSKPMDDTPKSKKPVTKPDAAPAALATPTKSTAAAKRPVEPDKDGGKDSKRRKKRVVGNDEDEGPVKETEKFGDDKKKQLFQRLWTEDDELAILKGMIDYYSKKGIDPSADMNAFHDFIKKSLHVDVTRNQLADKIRRLKKKYQNNVGRGKKGEDPVFSKPHEQKAFELSKKIWVSDANGVGIDRTISNGKKGKIQKVKNAVASPKSEALALPEVSKVAEKTKEELDLFLYPHLNESLQSEEILKMLLPNLGERIVKEGLGLVGSSKLKELDEKWKSLRMAEIDIRSKRMGLIAKHMKLILDAHNSETS